MISYCIYYCRVGYGLEQGFLYVKDTGGVQISAAYLNINGNTMQFYFRAPLRFECVRGVLQIAT